MSIIDGCIALFIFACGAFVCTCNPDMLHPHRMERFATSMLCLMGLLITAAFMYLVYIF